MPRLRPSCRPAACLLPCRYAAELEGVREVVANDLDPSVVESMKRNIEFNGGVAKQKVTPSVGDARLACLQVGGARRAGRLLDPPARLPAPASGGTVPAPSHAPQRPVVPTCLPACLPAEHGACLML